MRRLLVSLMSLLSLPLLAQSTNVTATITDSTGQTWFNGSFSVTFVPTPGLPNNYQWQGTTFQPQTYQGVMNGSGTMTITLPDNFTITPAGTQWAFVLCPNATAACTTVTTPVTGSSQNLSTLFSSRVLPPLINAAQMPRAYSTAEVPNPPPQQGGQFYRVVDNTPLFWSGTQWIALGGTLTGLTMTVPTSVFNLTGSPCVSGSCSLALAFNNATAFNVLANCTNGSAPPSFCQLNASMIAVAGTLSNNISGNAATASTATLATSASQSDHTPTTCTGNQWSIGVGALWNATCTQPGFSNLSGNIAVGQMNSGTGASSSTYWRGDGTWHALPTIPNVQSASASSVCTTGNTSFNACSTAITWPVAFADTAYQAVCFGVSPSDARAYIDGILTKTTTGVTVQVVTGGSVAVTYGTVDCIAMHP